MKLKTRTCKRCGHTWVPRRPRTIQCPKCRSPYWDKPRSADPLGALAADVLNIPEESVTDTDRADMGKLLEDMDNGD